MTEPDVAIVVTAIRDPDRLRRCVEAARRAAVDDGYDPEIVLALDDPEPALRELAEQGIDHTTVVMSDERHGLAATLNAGFRATTAPLVCVLQDDVLVQPGWLSTLVATITADERAGGVGARQLRPDGTVQVCGAIVDGRGQGALAWIGTTPSEHRLREVTCTDVLPTACQLVRRDAWAAVGGYDEDFFPLEYVDVDFSTALWHAGWTALVNPRAVVVHSAHGSSPRALREFLVPRNRARFCEKWRDFISNRGDVTSSVTAHEAEIARLDRWFDEPPPSVHTNVGAPEESPVDVHRARERTFLRDFVDFLEERPAELEARLTTIEDHYRNLEREHLAVDAHRQQVIEAYLRLEDAYRALERSYLELERAQTVPTAAAPPPLRHRIAHAVRRRISPT